MGKRTPLGLFEAFGVELEYMIVDSDSLKVLPIADKLLSAAGAGEAGCDVEFGPIAWSNELALHVVEFKTNGPRADLSGLDADFQENVERANALLAPFGGMLLPTGMHPTMDPDTEFKIWPHEYNEVYRTFDRIFGCKGHGWSNLQSTHINLPFRGDAEFAALHAAIRLILPILPALAASSPFLDGGRGPALDMRLACYQTNAERVPSVCGGVIPESMASKAQYEGELLGGIYRDLAELDPDGVLRHEWVNSRGCIARFDRMAIEIRLLDIQECPRADLGIVEAVIGAVKYLCGLGNRAEQANFERDALVGLLQECIREGDQAQIRDNDYLTVCGLRPGSRSAIEIWQDLVETAEVSERCRSVVGHIGEHGCLARRLVSLAGTQPTVASIETAYREAAKRLAVGEMIGPA
ncbi:MAG: glutamate--cysteine ligase [Myxococcales bacterium]|nr:glutamate--cysteine ligase [Myxococcales bacterium]